MPAPICYSLSANVRTERRDGGDPVGVAFFHGAGLDYVSCSPYRVPVARLAAAHAALEPATLAALRDAKAIEATVEGHTIRFELADVGAVLGALDACVKNYGPKS